MTAIVSTNEVERWVRRRRFLASRVLKGAATILRPGLGREVDLSRRWTLRAFVVVNGLWFQSVGHMFWIILGGPGSGRKMDGPFDLILGLACYLAPFAVLEIYLRARDQGGALGKSVMAAALVVLTAAMGVGMVGASMFMWRPFAIYPL
jgi:hypothetical protein